MKRLFVPILVVFSVFYSCKNQQEKDQIIKQLNNVAGNINKDLGSIRNEIFNLASSLQYKVEFDKDNVTFSDEKYHYHQNEILFCNLNCGNSAVYYPANKSINKQLKKMIVNSESLDTLFICSVQNCPLLSQIYFLDTNSFLRIYPYINVLSYLKNSVDLKSFIAYQTANKKPIIQDQAYWTSLPFADPYGRGWIISCIEPVYYRDRFLGVLSGDVTLQSIKNKYFSSATELMLMIDQEGKIICFTKEAAKIIDIPTLREFNYYKPVTENIYIYNAPSLIEHKNKNLKNAVISLLSGKNKESFFIDNKKYTIYKTHIKETDWMLLKIIN